MTFEHVQTSPGLLEGPCVLGDAIVFSNVLAGGVYRLGADDSIAELLPRRRGIGGIAATVDDGLVLTGKDVTLLDASGRTRTLYEDPSAAGFNDIGTRRDGSVVVGVLRYRPLAGDQPQPGELLGIRADGATEIVARDFVWPNGVVECQDGSLLASDFARGHVKRVAPDGATDVFFELADGAPDGLALDAERCLWIASGHGGSLLRVAPDGELTDEIDLPAQFASSLCFAGSDLRTLIVTTGEGVLLRTAAPVAGALVPPATLGA